MPEEDLKRAGSNALQLATDLAERVFRSTVPPAHWEEVAQRFADLLTVAAQQRASNETAQSLALEDVD